MIDAADWPPPMPTKADGERAWRALYVDQMVKRGVPVDDARAAAAAAEVDFSEDPAESADAELECWTNDG